MVYTHREVYPGGKQVYIHTGRYTQGGNLGYIHTGRYTQGGKPLLKALGSLFVGGKPLIKALGSLSLRYTLGGVYPASTHPEVYPRWCIPGMYTP